MSYPQYLTKTIKEFQYFAPKTLDEAVSILKKLDGKVKILAGGTDLLPQMKLRMVTPKYVISIGSLEELDYIREEENSLKIGALTTISTIGESAFVKRKCFSVYEATKTFGTPQVRNMATVGGNICRSSPSADMVPPLMTFDAMVKLVGPKGERKVVLEDFFTGSGENLLQGDILTEIVLAMPENRCGTAYQKITRNSADLAKVNCAVRITVSGGKCDDIRIVLGAVANTPIRARQAELAIRGKEISDEVIEIAAQKAVGEIAPITDVRSTAEYRTRVSRVLVRRLTKLAIERAKYNTVKE
jgi:carbon-monoxide dehydrogenase medium subunit